MSVCLRACFSLSLSLTLRVCRDPDLQPWKNRLENAGTDAAELLSFIFLTGHLFWRLFVTLLPSPQSLQNKRLYFSYLLFSRSLSLSLSLPLSLSLSLSSGLLFDPVCPYEIPYYTRISVEYYDTKYTGVYGN
jgi:hypothetical protein